jgi:YfiH family protein
MLRKESAMVITVDQTCRILFGDATTNDVHHKTPDFLQVLASTKQQLNLNKLVFQHQVHGLDGRYLNDKSLPSDEIEFFKTDGDLLITNQPNLGIGVLTADCLPIVFYAPKHHVLAVAHAGWRGSVMGIAVRTIELMRQHHKILPQDLLIFFGPSAKCCCYAVGKEFAEHLEPFDYKDKLLTKREGKLFFDNPLLNKLQLIDLGISPSQIDTSNNHCTICNLRFHSYRRTAQKESYKVQPTLAWLTA